MTQAEEHETVQDKKTPSSFDEHKVLHDLKHFLPAQASLKDFIHHNTLHAFQTQKFFEGTQQASAIFGYKVSLTLREFRDLYHSKQIRKDILEQVIANRKGAAGLEEWKDNLLSKKYETVRIARIGSLRVNWKRQYKIDLDSLVHPLLFRILCSYLDQGIAMWNFPVWHKGFLASIREIEHKCYTSFFKTKRARELLLKGKCTIEDLLKILVGHESLYSHYLFDQQFAHQGWSGIVSVVESDPLTLLDHKKITLHDLIIFELLMEIDALDHQFGDKWQPISAKLKTFPEELFAPVPVDELDEVMMLWQEAFEWSFYDQVLAGIKGEMQSEPKPVTKGFQAMFCIDDRECSFRRYLEKLDPTCQTFATPGFFNVEFFFKPQGGKFVTKLCPAPMTPKYIIKETGSREKRQKDVHFNKGSNSLFRGWIITQTLGFWAALRLFANIFRPTMTPATATSFKHMDRLSKLSILNEDPEHKEDGLQVGFTFEEMVTRVEGLLKSIGLVKDFAPVVYAVGHGSSSVNNPHYAAYDCGACSGRPGSVNARVFCFMANHPKVREMLVLRGIVIPDTTHFMGALHDTTRDEIQFYDEESLSRDNLESHRKTETIFLKALDLNSKERSRRLVSINSKLSAQAIHKKILTRSVTLFEPRPELNHATNALCIVGRRSLTKGLFLDRRSFMNSFDYQVDPEGKYLFNILKAAAPVCGGINLEYFFSRVDNQKLGAGTKLPHNVMGLFGVANGTDGDLRPGLPSQMIEVHDPVRLLIIVEHFPSVVLETIQKLYATYEWFINEWIHLIVINPETHEMSYFKDGSFIPYKPLKEQVDSISDLTPLFENNIDNLPVYAINRS